MKAMNTTAQGFLDISQVLWIDVDQFYGIEYEEFPARIAEVAMWLIDHQMNMMVSAEFGQYFIRLPLDKSAKIVHGNALRVDWAEIVSKNELSYIIGNPPFLGHHMQNINQKSDLHYILKGINAAGVMDYVSAWYYKAAELIQDTKIKVAFVSTNSIVQGEQVGILWNFLLLNFKINIHFAHRTFKWSNEAKGNAAVYCVIIGFANFDVVEKSIFEYENIKGEAHEIKAKNINPYLIDAKNILISNRSTPLCKVPKMRYGNKPTDGGHFILSNEEKVEFLKKEPKANKFIKQFISGREFIKNELRWCIWLVDAEPKDLKELPLILERIELVKKFRSESVASSTSSYKYHNLFRQITQPKSDFLLIPRTTSENRDYIPINFFTKDIIVSDTCQSIPNAKLYHFGILTSTMHMAWVKSVCGRLESRFRYSKDIVYNNYPWPEHPTEKQVSSIEAAAQKVLDV